MNKFVILPFVLTFAICGCSNNNPNPPIEPVELIVDNYTDTFESGKGIFFDGDVYLKYTDNTKECLSPEDYTFTTNCTNIYETGNYEATIKHENISKSFNIRIKKMESLKVLFVGNSYSDDTINILMKSLRILD